MSSLTPDRVGQSVLVRARVHNVRGKGKSCFLVLRQATATVQAAMFVDDQSVSKVRGPRRTCGECSLLCWSCPRRVLRLEQCVLDAMTIAADLSFVPDLHCTACRAWSSMPRPCPASPLWMWRASWWRRRRRWRAARSRRCGQAGSWVIRGALQRTGQSCSNGSLAWRSCMRRGPTIRDCCCWLQVELHVTSIHCVSRSAVLPFEVRLGAARMSADMCWCCLSACLLLRWPPRQTSAVRSQAARAMQHD